MARQKTQRMDKVVRDEMMWMLRERVKDPTVTVIEPRNDALVLSNAVALLRQAGYLDEQAGITLAGMDYHRQQTANPVLTWLRANWFAVIVAGCTIGVSVFGIVSG